MSDYKDVATYLDELVHRIMGSDYDGDYAAAVDEYADPEYLDTVDPAEYEDGLKKVLEHWQVPADAAAPVYDDAEAGDYTVEDLKRNISLLLENEDIKTHIDNSANVGDYAHVHGGVDQYNETNVANATGDQAIAGQEQWGQFQTGDGVQVGDYNQGVVNQGDNSGQQAGHTAHADDITTGDGNFNNEGTIEDSAVAFGGGSAYNQADDVYDASINDSFNTTDSGNVTDSYDTENSGNTTVETSHDVDIDAHLDVDVVESFNEDNDDVHDDSYTHTEVADDHYGS